MENGLTEEKIARLDKGEPSGFTARETHALAYAEKLALDHHSMGDEFFDELRTQFTDPKGTPVCAMPQGPGFMPRRITSRGPEAAISR